MSLNINKYLTHLIKTYPIIFRFLTSNQITIGAKYWRNSINWQCDISARNLWNTVTDKHDTRSKKKVLQNSIVWLLVWKPILQYEEPQDL
jgi:hypothetical protein